MAGSFEQCIDGELDGLYAGALFLTGGHPHSAQDLVVDVVRSAAESDTADRACTDPDASLDRRLVRTFLDPGPPAATGVVPDSGSAPVPPEVSPSAHEGSAALFRAAATIPLRARAALWLVLLQRWSYSDAAEELGIDRSHLTKLLGFRSVLVDATLDPAEPGHRSTGEG